MSAGIYMLYLKHTPKMERLVDWQLVLVGGRGSRGS